MCQGFFRICGKRFTFAFVLIATLANAPLLLAVENFSDSTRNSWRLGVVALQNSAQNDIVEYGTAFLLYSDNFEERLPALRGSVGKTHVPDIHDVKLYVRRRLEYARDVVICTIHTHPVGTVELAYGVANGRRAFAPPSVMGALDPTRFGDVLIVSEMWADYYYGLEHLTGVRPTALYNAVFGPQGIWYYRFVSPIDRENTPERYPVFPLTDEEYRASLRSVKSLSSDFGRASVRDGFNFVAEYEKLKRIYLEKTSTLVRFVSYDQVAKEPPCAGPDYEPNT